MNWMEAALLILGAGAFIASFIIPEKKEEEEDIGQIDVEVIRKLIDKEMEDAKSRIAEAVDETIEYAMEKTERASERISNEKIMAISEYSETVLADMNKAHQEVMFLYDMLNDKHNNLKETVKQVDKQAKEAEEKVTAAANVLAAKEEASCILEKQTQLQNIPQSQNLQTDSVNDIVVKPVSASNIIKEEQISESDEKTDFNISEEQKEEPAEYEVDNRKVEFKQLQVEKLPEIKETKNVEVYSFAEQAPRVERPVKQENREQDAKPKEAQALSLEHTITNMKNQQMAQKQQIIDREKQQENNNDRILRMYREGRSNVEIAKELGLGVGEVKLVINLFKGAV